VTAGPTVHVFYTCHACGVVEREIHVVARYPGQGVVGWMSAVQAAASADDATTSPSCRSQSCDLKIPLASKDAAIGEAVRH
jgi:hypothetical protein